MNITELRVNHLQNPLGFSITNLSFSWKVTNTETAKKAKTTRVLVKRLNEMVYDSGFCEEADSLDFRVDLTLEPRTRYEWTVFITADNGEQAQESSWFETGKMTEQWLADWITPKELPSAVQPVLSKKFQLENVPKLARLYLCGLGVYECYLNGQKIGNEYLAPGYHSYDFHLQVQTYDVSEQLQKGENELSIWLGNGWFKGRIGFDGGYTDVYGDRCYAIGELYGDGALIVNTDESWLCKASPVIESSIYDGEKYDARMESGLKEPDGWSPVTCQSPKSCGALTDRYSLPIVKKQKFDVIEWIHTPKQENVLDFGQNLTGWVEFDSQLPEGYGVRFTASEIMQDGCFYHDNLRTAKTEFTYISNGTLSHVRPHFTFYGFRYMKLEYLDSQGHVISKDEVSGDISHIDAIHLRSDFDEIGKIVTGHQGVNQLFSNAMWGQKDNFLDVPTDCPQRDERLGWTGDAQVFSETACYNMYMPAFYRKYLWDMRAEQSILDGSVPNVVPRLKREMIGEHGSCPWADAGVIIPWNVYLQYGSRTLLEECYPGMKAWLDYERKKEEEIGGKHLVKDGFHFADWLALDNEKPGPFGATDPLYIASAYYYRNAAIVSESAQVLGYEQEAQEYGELAKQILSAIQETYFDEEGLCVCKTQTGSAIAIEFGLIPERAKESVEGAMLRERVLQNDHHLNTGFVGTTMLCPALTDTGSNDLAVELLLNEQFPGWLYCVNLGATTIWERWDSVLEDGHISPEGMNSLNHYSYGSIEAWMYKDVCGIRPMEPGYRKARIAPHPDPRLGFADCRLDTAIGRYHICWKYEENGTISFELEIPFGASAVLELGGETELLEAGTYTRTVEIS